MNRLYFYFIFIFFALTVNGKEDFPLPPAKQYLNKLPEEMQTQDFKTAISAVKTYRPAEDTSCSLVVISNSCYAISAGHCFTEFLEKQGYLKREPHKNNPLRRLLQISKEGTLDIEVPTIEQNQIQFTDSNAAEDEVFIDGKSIKRVDSNTYAVSNELNQKIRELKKKAMGPLKISIVSKKAKLIAIGTGKGAWEDIIPPVLREHSENYPGHENLEDVLQDLKANGFGDLADYALIKLPEDKCDCAKTGKINNEHETVATIGFPADADRLSLVEFGNLSDLPPKASISTGEICKKFDNNLSDIYSKLKPFKKLLYRLSMPESPADRLNDYQTFKKVFKNDIIFANARTYKGGSGGGLFNMNAELVGITIKTYDFDTTLDPFSASLSLSSIKNQLMKKLTPEIFQEAFKCESPEPH